MADLDGSQEVFRDGYVFVNVPKVEHGYRAFFKQDWIEAAPYEATIIFCLPGTMPIGAECGVMGVSPMGCFQTGYGWYRLSEIQGLIDQIRKNYPAWDRNDDP